MMSTGSWMLPSQAFEQSLADLKQWRDDTAACLADFRRWATLARMIDEPQAARLAYLERRLAAERLTIAFVGESASVRAGLINALFFTHVGVPLLPTAGGHASRCSLEISADASRPPMLRLLPIESRASAKALRELALETEGWAEVALDPSDAGSVVAALRQLSEAVVVDAAQAEALGLSAADGARVAIPRWRHAMLNYPHPLLAKGITLLDAGDTAIVASEPEITFNRLPNAAAVVFVLSGVRAASAEEQALWFEHVATIGGIEQSGLVALDGIDELRAAAPSENEALAAVDRTVRSVADSLRIAPMRIFAVSSAQAFAAKTALDRDGIVKSRLYRLEQAIARGIVHQRRVDHVTAVRAEARGVFAETGALVRSRLAFAEEQVGVLVALQSKNQKLVEALAKKATLERARLEQARAALAGLRSAHGRLGDELARRLDPAAVRASADETRAAIGASKFSKAIPEQIAAFCTSSRQRMAEAVQVMEEAKHLMTSMSRKFLHEYRVAAASEVAAFATARFDAELERLEAQCARDFKGGAGMMLRSHKALGALFYDTVAVNVMRVFEIADRETRAWMQGFIRPIETEINASQEQSNTRIEGMGRIQNAETDLIERLEELRTLASELAQQHEAMQSHQERLLGLLDVQREATLA
jgi:hypothetical protein